MSSHVAIRSTGMYLPENEVPNDVLRARFAKSAPEYIDKMEATTGIKTRWYAPETWATSTTATSIPTAPPLKTTART